MKFTARMKFSQSENEKYFLAVIMKDKKLVDMSTDLSVKAIKLCGKIKGHYSISNQLERSATSIGANIREANYAHGKRDFVSKFKIALKECYETEYWLEIIQKSEICSAQAVDELMMISGAIRKMLIASINTATENKANEK